MKKYIAIEEEVLARLVLGKCVEGRLFRDKWTGVITFNAYNRQPRCNNFQCLQSSAACATEGCIAEKDALGLAEGIDRASKAPYESAEGSLPS